MLADQISVYFKEPSASQENILEKKPVASRTVLQTTMQGIIVVGIIVALIVITILLHNGRASSGQNTRAQTDEHSPIQSTGVSLSSSKLISTNYASRLTDKSSTYARADNNIFYYEAIKFTVPISGNYSFRSTSTNAMYGYLYKNSFNPFRAIDNYLLEDDDSGGSGQFLIQYTLQANTIYILLATTSPPRVLTAFSIVAQGPAKVNFLFISETTTIPPALSMSIIDSNVNGIYNTIAGGNSLAATSGNRIGNYLSAQSPNNAIDNDVKTKYLNFGACTWGDFADNCGINTGFYLTLPRGPTTVTGFRLCTADENENRDPMTVTLEGSKQSGRKLTVGTSWSLIYSGVSGLSNVRARGTCGPIQYFTNSIQYASYRFLVTGKRGIGNSVQYAEIQFFGI